LIRIADVPTEVDSLLWVEAEGEQIVAHKWSSAVLATVKYVGGPWRLFRVALLIPRPLRDAGYRLFARHRSKVAAPACLIPAPATRMRFLDA
jgi:predicted DCC family thiol-disulfide oxidoreductase YuxK